MDSNINQSLIDFMTHNTTVVGYRFKIEESPRVVIDYSSITNTAEVADGLVNGFVCICTLWASGDLTIYPLN